MIISDDILENEIINKLFIKNKISISENINLNLEINKLKINNKNNKYMKDSIEDLIIVFNEKINIYNDKLKINNKNNNFYVINEEKLQNNNIFYNKRKPKNEKNIDEKKKILLYRIKYNYKKYSKNEELYKLVYKENRLKIDTLSYIYNNYNGDSKNNDIKELYKDYDQNLTRFTKIISIYSYIKNNHNLYNSKYLFLYNTFDILNKKDDLLDIFNYIEKQLLILK